MPARRPVIVESGRRIDAKDSGASRFPPGNVEKVRERIRAAFRQATPIALVCSAACGADLVALDVAGELAIERTVILPSPPEEFRLTSVIDRGGDWGGLFDRVLREVEYEVVPVPDGDEGYLQTNLHLFKRAEIVAARHKSAINAMIVWDGEARGKDDVTARFLQLAQSRGVRTLHVGTL